MILEEQKNYVVPFETLVWVNLCMQISCLFSIKAEGNNSLNQITSVAVPEENCT